MQRASSWLAAAGPLLAAAAACTAAPAPQATPGPGETAATASPAEPAEAAAVRFVQGMIAHHAQALDMTALVPARSTRADVRLLAERIEVSQRDEIAQMEAWLRRRGAAVPGPHAHHEVRMPGMLAPEELARLAAATGEEFERLFLDLMIRHHEGALAMVAELFASGGAGRDTQLFQIASDVDADQRMEIDRMRRMQGAPPSGARPR